MANFTSTSKSLTLQDDKGVWAQFKDGQFETSDASVIKRLRSLPESEGIGEVEASTKQSDAAPAKSAAKSDWVTWAVRCGADQTSAEAATRDQLVEQFADAAPKE